MNTNPKVIVLTENPVLSDFVMKCFGEICMPILASPSPETVKEIARIGPQVLIVDSSMFSHLDALQKETIGCELLIVVGQPGQAISDRDFDILVRAPFGLFLLRDLVMQYVNFADGQEEDSLRGYLFDLLKRLSTALESSFQQQALLDSVLECISSGVIVTDLKGKVVRANPEARRILGEITSEIEGRTLSDIIGFEPARRVLETKKGQFSYRNEIVLELPSGRTIILGYTTTDRKDSFDRAIGKIISFRDLTELKELQYEVEKLNRFSIVAEIASAVAHEIRNPLAGIRAMAQAIDEAMKEGDPKKEYIQRIIRQTDRLNEILKSFFNYAKPPEPNIRPVDLDEVINELEPLIASRLQKKGVSFVKRIQKGLPPLLFDPAQLQQVLLNLILNAIDAVPEDKGTIEICAREIKDFSKKADNIVRIDVRDNGEGIPGHLQGKVFMPFFTTKAWGTGLGLAVVRRIVEENSGQITLTSTPGKGTTFTLYIKCADGNRNSHKDPSGGG